MPGVGSLAASDWCWVERYRLEPCLCKISDVVLSADLNSSPPAV